MASTTKAQRHKKAGGQRGRAVLGDNGPACSSAKQTRVIRDCRQRLWRGAVWWATGAHETSAAWGAAAVPCTAWGRCWPGRTGTSHRLKQRRTGGAHPQCQKHGQARACAVACARAAVWLAVRPCGGGGWNGDTKVRGEGCGSTGIAQVPEHALAGLASTDPGHPAPMRPGGHGFATRLVGRVLTLLTHRAGRRRRASWCC